MGSPGRHGKQGIMGNRGIKGDKGEKGILMLYVITKSKGGGGWGEK